MIIRGYTDEQVNITRKRIIRLFKEKDFSLEIKTKLKQVNFFIFNLENKRV